MDASAETMSLASAPPPPYSERTSEFAPTLHFQIETPGKPVLSLPLPPRPDPIPIFAVDPYSSSSSAGAVPQYFSIRPARNSGSCILVAPDPSDLSDAALYAAASTTTYRFGPGRPPRVRLLQPGTLDPSYLSNLPELTDNDGADNNVDLTCWDAFEVRSLGLLTRSVTMRTRLGTFEWRYASRAERRAAGPDVNSLLVLERVVKVAIAGAQGKEEVLRTPVAHFVRSAALRSRGSSACSAGNGGRLMIDVGLWGGDEADAKNSTERDMAVVLAITTCLVMLKKEVDRRRAQQIAVMAGAGSGGP